MKNVNFYSVIIPIFLIVLTLQSSILRADDWKQKLNGLNKPRAGISGNSLYEPISNAQSRRVGSEFVRTSPLPATTSSIFTVTTTQDTGSGSLRKAITDANNTAGKDIIQFDIPVSGVSTFRPQSPLPEISDPVIIDGTTQPGYSGMPLIEIDGINAGSALGLDISAGNSTIKGLIINHFSGSGILLWSAGGNVIEGSFIGTDATGKIDIGNGGSGIVITSPNNKIGNANGAINVISANDNGGIFLSGVSASGNRIVHSHIGTSVDGTGMIGNNLAGIYVQNSSSDTIGGVLLGERNIISGNYQSGISIRGQSAQSILIQGNYIGTESNGSLALGNLNGIEILPEVGLGGTPSYITIGGSTSAAMNLISGNTSGGITFFPDGTGGVGNVIIGNLIGTDISGTAKIPNVRCGIFVQKYADNNAGILIGGVYSDSGNIISGNYQFGIWMRGSGVKNNFIRGNYIGTSKESLSGISALENQYAGIFLDNAPANTVGGETPVAGNVIGSNGGEGIAIIGDTATGNSIRNNWIGTNPADIVNLGNQGHGIYIEASQTVVGDVNGTNIIAHNHNRGIFIYSGTKNTIRFNSIHDNDSLGIDLSPERLTPNDRKDVDTGANNLQNFPLLDSASLSGNSIHIKGRFDSEPNTQYTIDFFKNKNRNASHFGEGEKYIGSVTVQCDTGGRKDLDVILPEPVSGDEFITATSTDSQGNTSEFSRALCLKDSDGDGILDCWESEGDGIDVNADGIIDYDLWSKGARPIHKDMFVEVDWMAGFRPKDSSMTMVVDAFKNVPNSYVNNPDAKPGIHLVAEVSADTLPLYSWQADPWPEFFLDKKSFFGTNEEWASSNRTNILEAKRLVYRYCVFGYNYDPDGSSGIAELNNGAGGNDFIVSLGTFRIVGGDKFQQAGTFMHELGHTLGLRHGGVDDKHFKPNFYSVMNYTWQFPKKDGSLSGLTWKLDYSPAALPTLLENSLNEAAGLGPQLVDYPDPIFVPFSGPGGVVRIGILYPTAAIDWDGNGDSSGLATMPVDINNLGSPPSPSPGDTLEGFADWKNLKYNFRNSLDFRDPSMAELRSRTTATIDNPKEMTPAMDDYIQSLPPYGIVPQTSYPTIIPVDTTLVGGNPLTIVAWLTSTAPAGGLTYTLLNSDTTALTVPPTITVPAGSLVSWVEAQTHGVAEDHDVQVTAIGGRIPVTSKITVKPANLLSFAALADSGCAIMEQSGFRNKFLAGCTILSKTTLDGEAPPSGGVVQISSSRPDLINPAATDSFAGFERNGFISVNTSSTVGAPQDVILTATYRGVSRKDTVILMPAPVYTFTDISQTGSTGYNYQAINNAGEVLIDGVTLLRNGSYVRLDTLPGFQLTSVVGMNDIGWFCGAVWDATLNHNRAAYWKPNTTILLPLLDPSHPSGGASAINNRGDVIGSAVALTYPYELKPVMWRSDAVTPLEGYFDYTLYPVALNDAGQVVGSGYYYRASPYTNRRIGVRWDNGVLTPLFHPWGEDYFLTAVAIAADGTALLDGYGYFHLATNSVAPGFGPPPPYNRMTPYDMNDSLVVVGELRHQIEDVGTTYSSFVARNGYLYDLKCLVNFPAGWSRMKATGINNAGTIVGVAEKGGEVHLFLLKRSEPTDVGEEAESKQLPEEFRLLQNYPNPFNPSTTIKFQTPTPGFVSLKVFDVLGREVARLVNSEMKPGSHSVEWNALNVPSGVYFYRLQAGSFSETKKLVLLR